MNRPPSTPQYDAIGGAGLRFFGQVSASIAHEIKNVLAIINENTGLLEDLSFAARRGSAIDPERLNKACGQFSKQIQRADEIIRNMSRFAHSVDHFEGQIDLHELTVLVTTLAGRLAAMRKLTLRVEQPAMPVMLSSNPFLLQNCIWMCLEFAFGLTGPGGQLLLKPGREPSGITLRIGGIDRLDHDQLAHLPQGYKDLETALGIRSAVAPDTAELILQLT